MESSKLLTVLYLVLTLQTLASTLPRKASHREHHQGHQKHVKKSKTQTPSGNSPAKILEKISEKLGLGDKMPSFPDIFNPEKGSKLPKNVKTKTKTTTKVDGPFKTVTTVTEQFETDKHNKTHLVGQSVQSVTTAKNSTKRIGKPKKGIYFDLNPFGFTFFGDEGEQECSDQKPCKEKGTYCDQKDWECRPLVKVGEKCYQPGQCGVGKKGQVACVWGTCTLSTKAGDAGTFCEKDSNCASSEMRCVAQEDVSEFSNICVPKPGEGQTCGRRSMFDYWPVRKYPGDSPCKKGFACIEVGNFGRKICRPEAFVKDQKIRED